MFIEEEEQQITSSRFKKLSFVITLGILWPRWLLCSYSQDSCVAGSYIESRLKKHSQTRCRRQWATGSSSSCCMIIKKFSGQRGHQWHFVPLYLDDTEDWVPHEACSRIIPALPGCLAGDYSLFHLASHIQTSFTFSLGN